MFKRARRRIEKSKKEHELGLTPEVKVDLGLTDSDSDSDESLSDSGGESSGAERPSRKRKRRPEDDEEGGDTGEGEGDSRSGTSEDGEEGDSELDAGGIIDDETGAVRGPTVEDALIDPLFFVSELQQACAVCPGRRLKNAHMAEQHTGAMHHLRRYTRFKHTVERLATRFDDTHSDFASNVVLVMDSVQQGKPGAASHEQSGQSKRALKKQKLALKRGRQHKKNVSKSAATESQPPQAKEILPGSEKSLKRRKLGADNAEHKYKRKPSLQSTTSTSKRRLKAVDA